VRALDGAEASCPASGERYRLSQGQLQLLPG